MNSAKRETLLLCALVGTILAAGTLFVLPIPIARAAATVNVSIYDYGFNPSSVSIAVGDTVTWTNTGYSTHTVTSDTNGLFDSGDIAPGQTFSYTFMSAGSFGYHCSIHPSLMMGTVNVGTSTTTTSSSSTSSTTSISSSTSSTSTIRKYTTSTTYRTSTSSTSTSATSSSTSTTSVLPSTSSSSPLTSQTSTAAGNGIPEFPFQAVTVAALTLILAASYLVARRSLRT